MARHRWMLALAMTACAGTTPLGAQVRDWQYRWYWGAKGGVVAYYLPNLPDYRQVIRPQFGGEWLITARRTALYIGYSQSLTQEGDWFAISGISSRIPIVFDGMRRVQINVVVLPMDGTIQPYLGGGFVIETLPNAAVRPDTTLSSSHQAIVDRELPELTSGGFGQVMLGLQLRMRKLALFGHYQVSPQGRDFLLSAASHSVEFGVRYALLGAREDDVTTRR